VAAVTEAEARRREEEAARESFRAAVAWLRDVVLDAVKREHETQAAENASWRISATRQLQRRPKKRKGQRT
jgi:hypothetical protein